MAYTLEDILGGKTAISGLLSPESNAIINKEAQAQGLLSLGLNLLANSQGLGRKPSTAQVLGQSASAGLQAYRGAQQETQNRFLQEMQMRQKIGEMSQPKYMTLKSGDGEILVQIPKTGTPSVVGIPGLSTGGSIKFDDTTRAYMSYKYPGKAFGDLSQDQQVDVISFANAPNDEKIASLKVESSKSKFETGVDVPIPRGRSEFLSMPPTPVTTPTQIAPAAPTQIAPAAPIQIAPTAPTSTTPVSPSKTSLDMTTPQTAQVIAKTMTKTEPSAVDIRVPMSLVSKEMTKKEVPLIESSGISPKQKQELLLQQPQATGAVESVVNTNIQMRNVVDEILANPGLKDAFGLGGEAMSKFPGSNAARVRALLERLGGNLFVDAITAMRNASKTGAAVGNATEKEGDKLQASRAALSQAQKAEDVIRELIALKSMLEQQEKITINAYNRTYGFGNFQFVPQKPPPNMRQPLESIFGTQR